MRMFQTICRTVVFLVCIPIAACDRGHSSEPAPEIHPPVIPNGQMNYSLPGRVMRIISGGCGRYLILDFPEQSKLALFDVNEAKITHEITIDLRSDQIQAGSANFLEGQLGYFHFAANKTSLVVADPKTKMLTRYDLATLTPQLSVPWPIKYMRSMAMGYASDGPLLIEDDLLLDAQTLTPISSHITGGQSYSKEDDRYPYFVNASADGQTFGGTIRGGISPSGVDVMHLDANGVGQWSHEHEHAGDVTPTWDGKYVCTWMGVLESKNGGYFDKFPRVSKLTLEESGCESLSAVALSLLPLAAPTLWAREKKQIQGGPDG